MWRSLGPGIMTVSSDLKTSYVLGVGGKSIFNGKIINSVNNVHPSMTSFGANSVSVVLNNKKTES